VKLLLFVLLSFLFAPAVLMAQTSAGDSIYYNSTCSNTSISFGATVYKQAPFPTKISWDFGDPASGIYNTAGIKYPVHTYTTPGKYYISLLVINNTVDTTRLTDSITIVDPMPYDFGPDIFLCQGQDTIVVAPQVPGAVYTWSDDSLTTKDTLHVTKSGVYTVNINGCAVDDSIGVFISTRPRINLGADHVLCNGENLSLNAATQNGYYTWVLNNDTLPNHESQQPVQAPGGQYAVIVTVPGCGVYSDTVNIRFAAPDAPAFSLGPDTLLCPKQVLPLYATTPGATRYQWNTGSTDSILNISKAGTYWVFVTIANQCQVTDTLQASYRGDRQLDFRDTAICQGSTLVLDANFGVGQYDWQAIPPQRDDQNQTGQSTYFVYKPGTYSITAAVGQCMYKDTLTVRFNDSLKVSLTKDTSLCYGEDFWLQATGNANTYTWQDGFTGPRYEVTQPGVYTVVAENGCGKDTLQTKIQFQPCACNLLLPNAFTPNADGRNDTFRPLHACKMSAYEMRIFNRFGEQVFQATSPDQAWDGTYKNGKAPAGTYVWMVRYTNTDTQQQFSKKGWVVLLR
jgi:gliding motility-associated-like protein